MRDTNLRNAYSVFFFLLCLKGELHIVKEKKNAVLYTFYSDFFLMFKYYFVSNNLSSVLISSYTCNLDSFHDQ